MSDEPVAKTYEGQPEAAPMPEEPIGSVPPAMPMPTAMPTDEAPYGGMEASQPGADFAEVVSEMNDYPEGRGGMGMVPMSETGTSFSGPGTPIGERPPATEMPVAADA